MAAASDHMITDFAVCVEQIAHWPRSLFYSLSCGWSHLSLCLQCLSIIAMATSGESQTHSTRQCCGLRASKYMQSAVTRIMKNRMVIKILAKSNLQFMF